MAAAISAKGLPAAHVPVAGPSVDACSPGASPVQNQSTGCSYEQSMSPSSRETAALFFSEKSSSSLAATGPQACEPNSLRQIRRSGASRLDLSFDHLEPVDSSGQRSKFWGKLVASQKTKGISIGRSVARPPAESLLGTGNYGQVWRAQDSRTGEKFAVKNAVLKDAQREYELVEHLKSLPHACIVRMFHVHRFVDVGLCCIVLELCAGGDLFAQVSLGRRQAREGSCCYRQPSQGSVWMGDAFLGLEHLHLRAGVLARDLKLANVLLDVTGRAKLCDFGLSRIGIWSDGDWTFGFPTGSPGYVAPEVLERESYDTSADLYSFGAMVWILASGGIASALEPELPTNMVKNGEYELMYDDWKLLRKIIESDNDSVAPPVDGDVRSLVLSLVVRDPTSRLTHEEIREHSYMKDALDLPVL